MSTELRNVPTATLITQTRFFGGAERGACIQLTAPFHTGERLTLSRLEALAVAQELILFANQQEIESVC